LLSTSLKRAGREGGGWVDKGRKERKEKVGS